MTPEGHYIVIDAGEGANMGHYLNWRYGSGKKTTFKAAIMSHPDSDHYQGFAKLFERENFEFETVYTNGLIERLEPKTIRGAKKARGPKQTSLGPVEKIGGVELVTELVTTKKELAAFLAVKETWVDKPFPTMLNEALEGWKVRTMRPPDGKESETSTTSIASNPRMETVR